LEEEKNQLNAGSTFHENSISRCSIDHLSLSACNPIPGAVLRGHSCTVLHLGLKFKCTSLLIITDSHDYYCLMLLTS